MIDFNEWALQYNEQQPQFKVGGNLASTAGGVGRFGQYVQTASKGIQSDRKVNALWQTIRTLYGDLPPDELVRSFENDWRTIKQRISPAFRAAARQTPTEP